MPRRLPSPLAAQLRRDLIARHGFAIYPKCDECGTSTEPKALTDGLCPFCYRESARSLEERPYSEVRHD